MSDRLRVTAVAASERAGRIAADGFRDGRLDGDYDERDAKTDLDRACERAVVDTIRSEFPDHAVRSEEAGRLAGAGDYEWIVDPLDGTNNVASGLPVFATAVCVRDADGLLLSVVHEPLPDDTYVARRGDGATVDGDPLSAGTDQPLSRGTVSLVPGYEALSTPAYRTRLDEIRDALDGAAKRVLETWAPCVDWGLLARGATEAVVTFRPDVWEQETGALLATEAGAAVYRDGPLSVFAADEETLTSVREALSS